MPAKRTRKGAVKSKEEKEVSNENGKQEETTVKKESKKNAKPKTELVHERKKRKLQDLKNQLRKVEWRELDFIGMEVGGMDAIYNGDFEFPDLVRELTQGALSHVNYPLYMFMGAQPIQSEFAGEIFNIPYIVVIDCKKPPSGRVALTSIQSGEEIIAPLNKFHLSWVPYIPKQLQNNVELPIQLYHLAWEGRKSTLKKLSAEELHKISLLLPYELLPHVFEEKDLEQRLAEVKSVNFVYTATNGKKVDVVWDKECHRLSIDVDVIVEDEKLDSSDVPLIKAALKQEFDNARAKVKEQYEANKKELEDLSPQDLLSLKEIKLYKFYPVHDTIQIEKFMSPQINRYYGNAHEVFPKKQEEQKTEPVQSFQPLNIPVAAEPTALNLSSWIPATNNPNNNANSDNASASFGFVFDPSKLSTSKPATSGWKCACCEQQNSVSSTSCITCMTPRPK